MIATILIAAALAYGLRIALNFENPRDFKYIWVAGKCWSAGGNPYLPSFTAFGNTLFPDQNLHRWLYSPHIWAISLPFSWFPFKSAAFLWALSSIALNFAASVVIVLALGRRHRTQQAMILSLVFGYSTVMIGGTTSLSTGQFSSIMFLGLALFLFAIVRNSASAMVAALVLLTMKASLGIPFALLALSDRRWWKSVASAVFFSLLLAAPALVIGGLGETIGGYLGGVSEYTVRRANSAESTTGFRNLAYRIWNRDPSGASLVLICSVVMLGGGLLIRGVTAANARLRGAYLSFALCLVLFVVPFHLYDLILICGLVAVVGTPKDFLWYIPGLLVLVRPNRLEEQLGFTKSSDLFPGSFLATLVLLALLVVATVQLAREFTRNRQLK